MPRVTISFSLPDERIEHRDAMNGPAAVGALIEIDHFCRNALKHKDHDEDAMEILRQIREMIPDQIVRPDIW